MEIKNIFNNILDSETLKFNLQHVSVFIAVFENLKSVVTDNVKSFYHCGFSKLEADGSIPKTKDFAIKRYYEIEDGYCHYYSQDYKLKIIERKVNGKKNILLSTMLWLVENKAITREDYDNFIEARNLRNKYAHEMPTIIFEGLPADAEQTFIKLIRLYAKIDKWWINNIEIETEIVARGINGQEPLASYDKESVTNIARLFLDIMIQVLYCNKEEEYKKIYEQIFNQKIKEAEEND